MSMYPYRVRTRVGDCFPHTNEGNVSAKIPPKTLLSLHDITPERKEEIINDGRVVVVQPVTGSDYIKTASAGKHVMVDEIKPLVGKIISRTPQGVSIIMGDPISEKDIAPNHRLVPVQFDVPGHSPIIAICVVIIIVAVAAALSAIAVSYYFSVAEMEQTKRHAMDVALQSQEIKDTEFIDLDTGEVFDEYVEGCDIERRYYANGEVLSLALNDTGFKYIGGTASIDKKGLDFENLLANILDEKDWWEDLIMWGVIAAVAVGGVVVAVKVIPSLLKKGGS